MLNHIYDYPLVVSEHRFGGVVHKRHYHKPKAKNRGRVDSIIHVARSRHSSAASWASELEAGLAQLRKEEEEKEKEAKKKGKKGKAKKKKSVQFKKQYDHRPHEVGINKVTVGVSIVNIKSPIVDDQDEMGLTI